MTKNKLDDLNDHLFAQLERLNDESLDEDQLRSEVKRADAMSSVAGQITAAAKLKMDAAKMLSKNNKAFDHYLPQTSRVIEHQPRAADKADPALLNPAPVTQPRLATAAHRAKPAVRADADIPTPSSMTEGE